MCGRISCYLAPEDLSCCCKYRDASGKESEVSWVPAKFQNVKYVPSYNMGPRDTLACIVAGSHFNVNSERILCPMMWGFIPPWHKIQAILLQHSVLCALLSVDKKFFTVERITKKQLEIYQKYTSHSQGDPKKHNATTHNGRLENLRNSKLYGKPLDQGKRCVVVINGFYEWQTNKETGNKQPYYMYKKESNDPDNKQEILTLAGLFDKWTSEEGETIYSCTILTTASNDVLSWLHHRTPFILQTEKDVRDWLNYKNVSVDKALANLRSTNLSTETLQWHPVASTVNNVRYKDKSCIELVEVGKEKKKAPSGLMSAWLKTGSMKSNKRKSTDCEDDQETDSLKQQTKALRKD